MRPRLVRGIIVVLALVAAGLAAGTGTAQAAVIVFEVAGTMTPFADFPNCDPVLTCTLSGSLTADESSNMIVAGDITLASNSAEPAEIDEFFNLPSIFPSSGLTGITIEDHGPDFLSLYFSTQTAGSLAGYTGGLLSSRTDITTEVEPFTLYTLISGSLTEGAGVSKAVPEPSTLALLVIALASFCAFLRRLAAIGEAYPLCDRRYRAARRGPQHRAPRPRPLAEPICRALTRRAAGT